MGAPKVLVYLTALLISSSMQAQARTGIHITHQYANLNAQSLIGLPMGDHKTIVDKNGNLHWSQWSLKRRGLDVPFGFSAQMDGALVLQLLRAGSALEVTGQNLYQGRFPFVVTHFEDKGLHAEELVFSTVAAGHGLDVVRICLSNLSSSGASIKIRLSGKRHNLPAHVSGPVLAARDGYLIALAQAASGSFSTLKQNLLLQYKTEVPAHSAVMLWLKLPYSLLARDQACIAGIAGSRLLEQAVRSWESFWARGTRIELPEREILDFYDSSLAYVVILTERGPRGDLWALDGPGVYRHYWGRGEYFQARALEVAGYLDIAKQTVEHALSLENDDGEWDRPAISGWPAWDNIGGEAAAVWDYYLFTQDKDWLRRAYPYLFAAARWIHFHREETELPADAPPGAEPIQRQIPWSCREEPNPRLKPGEKPYWWGLLPWSYGDSGLPEGHNFPANVMALYAVQCARQAAKELGRFADAAWLSKAYAGYRQAIRTAIDRSVKLEAEGPPYLPAMPTYPDAAVSQSLLAVYPTKLFSPDDSLVAGLLTRIERTELQGLPTNMAWMGPSGVWPGESMNMAETYLRRGDAQKTVKMLVAALNHSYTTDVWKEEIEVDDNLPVACAHRAPSGRLIPNGMGTGDMPEAWANANLVNLVRDMLLYREGSALHVLAGIPSDWIAVGESIRVENAPGTFGGKVSFRLTYPEPGRMILNFTPPAKPVNLVARFPLDEGRRIKSAQVNGKPVKIFSKSHLSLRDVSAPVTIEVGFE